jgi:hypothetical protein
MSIDAASGIRLLPQTFLRHALHPNSANHRAKKRFICGRKTRVLVSSQDKQA